MMHYSLNFFSTRNTEGREAEDMCLLSPFLKYFYFAIKRRKKRKEKKKERREEKKKRKEEKRKEKRNLDY